VAHVFVAVGIVILTESIGKRIAGRGAGLVAAVS
jgi:hypothetical protein